MSLPKYKYLLTYRYAEIIHDLTVDFCQIFLPQIDHRRTREQMIQAARSGKQNIIEGVGQARTSKKGEIRLLGVAKASLEELLGDYEDFLRQRKLSIWAKTDPKVLAFRRVGFRLSSLSNLSDLGDLKERPVLPKTSIESANLLVTLCHQVTFLLDHQINKAETTFVNEGGWSENLFKRRIAVKYQNK